MNFLILFALALAPGIAIVLFIYRKDMHEREPVLLLLTAFVYGMLSTLITYSISYPLHIFFHTNEGDVIDQFYNAFFKVALVEEISKFIFVRFVLYNNKHFNEPFDGIVYAVMVSMGFATVENVMYVFDQGIVTGVLRLFTAVPAHATFAILMGYFLGKARFNKPRAFYYCTVALLSATLFHGLYDYFWFISFVPGIGAGAVIALSVGFYLSRKAIKRHQLASPFINHKREVVLDPQPETTEQPEH
jgi:RsiW-degrading membrane proteinase PrsW (M82 family)